MHNTLPQRIPLKYCKDLNLQYVKQVKLFLLRQIAKKGRATDCFSMK